MMHNIRLGSCIAILALAAPIRAQDRPMERRAVASAVAAFFKDSLPKGSIAVLTDPRAEANESPEADQLAQELHAIKATRSAVVSCDAGVPRQCQLRGVSVLALLRIRSMTTSAAEASLSWETAGARGRLSFVAFRVALERRAGRWVVVRVLGQEAS